MQFTITCRRCGQVTSTNSESAQPIRGSAVGQAKDAGPQAIGYVIPWTHCGTQAVVRPEEGK